MNQVVRMQSPGAPPAVGDRSGSFVWNGTAWVPGPCDDCGPPPFPCPPSGFPPPGCPPWWSGANSPPWYPGANAGVSFGASPPSNPVRGHFWWDGTIMWMFDGAAWEQIGGAGTSGGTPPSNNPPANPSPGEQWFNGSTLFIWDGNAWIPVSQTKTYLQTTQPPAPNPGDLWYDGSVMRIWSGSAWQLVGPGAFQGPIGTSTITFGIAQNSAISTTPNTFVALPFTSTPQIDTQTAYDPVTHRLTPKVAGNYLVEARGLATGTVTGMAIVKNDQGNFNGLLASDIVPAIVSESSAGGWITCMGFVQMNGSTDFLRYWWYNSGGSFPAAGAQPCFSAMLLP